MVHNRIGRRTFLASAALLALPSWMPAHATTANWPNRPIRLVVPGPAGAGMDIFARMIAAKLNDALRQPVVVDNRPGANSLIGTDAVAKAAPDGYTLLMTPSSAVAINPIIQPKMPYDALKDLVPVAQVGAAGILLVANPATGLKNLADLVRYARAHPDKLVYGSWGNGSTGHLAMEGIKAHYGLSMQHVPFKGSAQLVTDLLANNIPVGFTDIASPVPHIRSGKLVALGTTGSTRGPALPNVPTLGEQGYRFDKEGWYGVFAPAGTPPEIVERLNKEINRILTSEDVVQKFAQQNMPRPPIKSVAEFANTVRQDVQAWQQLAKVAKLQID
ncbi:Bug family tripartite tricarboxylate transporter substrate binding protein [Cupriavidus gilardii]|uniref:Bug family tripartite tricarboxylate transporter substrate binding protein n=1 Tax=Cupriavidus gilardii TaxID=82541 RepID=UPI001572F33D|nr:tripartite tricarboxylate transporter substrate binding protein [Cupriavidus gilardii]NSX05487.1 tripartite tricarboxylate transporter substrate binding protein [Cupriavidus gilardii]